MLFKNYNDLILNGQTPQLQQKRKDALDILSAAVDAVQPSRVMNDVFCRKQLIFASEIIDLSTFDNIYVIGFGKASVGMAQAVSNAVNVTKGVIVTNDPSAIITNHSIEIIIGGHPVPNECSICGTEKILDLLGECSQNDCVIVLISGGGSSLLCKPRVNLDDLKKTINILLRSGVSIDEMNVIRKHLSFVKGGQLPQYTKAVIVSLIISDIVHDPITSIASGPTFPDSSTFSDARDVLKKYKLWTKVPAKVRTIITEGIAGRISETPKENNPGFDMVFNFIIAKNERACQSAIKKAKELGYDAKLMTTSLTGESRIIGKDLINRVRKRLNNKKTVIITGGETTVTVIGDGIGGRNQEFVLSCVEEISGNELVVASLATDGIDGNSNAAGAIADGYTLARAQEKMLNPSQFLKQNNSNIFFQALNDAFLTGSTGTNVMDIQIIIK